jgi:glucose/arabinose dehydrogenase
MVTAAILWVETIAAQNTVESRVLTFEGSNRPGPTVRVVQLTGGLVSPWSIAFVPGTPDLLIAERPGRIRIMRNNILDPTPVYALPPEPLERADGRNSAERLHFLVMHPQFVENKLVYLSYIKWRPGGHTLAIARGRFDGKTLTDVKDVFVADAWVDATKTSVPGATVCGRMIFGPDGMLYVTIGDRDYLYASDDASVRMKAQDLSSHIGKILRLRDDGTAPPDNPFVNRTGAKPEIYTYGHRNAMGLAFARNRVWEVEISPMGGDELNLLVAGHNYGWPLVSLGRIYTNHLVSEQPWWRPGMDNPEMFWSPAVSPSSVIFYTGDRFPALKNSLLIGALNGRALWHVSLTEDGLTTPGSPDRNSDWLDLDTRVRDVAQAPNGDLYISTETRNTDSSTNGMVLRIEPIQ